MSRSVVATQANFALGAGPASLDSLSANWRYNYRFFGGFNVTSNVLGGGDASGAESGCERWAGSGSFTADQYASVTLTGYDAGFSGHWIGPACRISADNDDGTTNTRDQYQFLVQDNGAANATAEKIHKVINGTVTVLASASSQTWSVDGDKADLEVEGTTLRGIRNVSGTLTTKLSTTDSDLANGTPGFGGSASPPMTISDWEGGNLTSGTTDRRAIVTWSELEVPDEPRRAIVTFSEFEVPNEPRRAIVTFTELETPDQPRRGIVTWVEFEVPDSPVTDRRAIVSWTELEVPDEPRRAIITWTELETPDIPRRAIVTWTELEVPDVPTLTFRDYGASFLFTAQDWKSTVAAYFEVYFRKTSGQVYARLYDITAGSAVSNSLLISSSGSFERLRSPVITLVDGHEYIVQVGKDVGDAGEIKSGRVVMIS